MVTENNRDNPSCYKPYHLSMAIMITITTSVVILLATIDYYTAGVIWNAPSWVNTEIRYITTIMLCLGITVLLKCQFKAGTGV